MDKEKINFLNNQINYICTKLNENNIDFYLVGAIGGYINAGLDLMRVHDDIDILIDEKYIDKLKEILNNDEYKFIDNRFTTNSILNDYGFPEGDEHDLYALYKDNVFHIGFFTYRVDNDNISFIDYFRDNNQIKRLVRTIPKEIFDYQYDDKYINYKGCNIKCVRKEVIYKNKKVMNREKDIFDIEKLLPYIDQNIMEKLSHVKEHRVTTIEDILNEI